MHLIYFLFKSLEFGKGVKINAFLTTKYLLFRCNKLHVLGKLHVASGMSFFCHVTFRALDARNESAGTFKNMSNILFTLAILVIVCPVGRVELLVLGAVLVVLLPPLVTSTGSTQGIGLPNFVCNFTTFINKKLFQR